MARSFMTHLMFTGKAEEAMNFYVSLFDNAEIKKIERYGTNEQGMEGTVKMAIFHLGGRPFMCIDSPPVHDFTFTPSTSIFVECESKEEIEKLFNRLSEDGKVLMPLGDYGFSEVFGWMQDRFGVSWQLNLARSA